MSEEEIIKNINEMIELIDDECYISIPEDIKSIKGLLYLYNKYKKDFRKLQAFYSKEYIRKDKIRNKIEYNKVFNDNIHKYATITLEDLLKEN